MTVSAHIADFTVSHYIELINLAKSRYIFCTYKEANLGGSIILWRHDCDLSLNRALRLAEIEADHEVRATYFINPHSEFYNPFEVSQSKIIKTILSLGHDLALHYDNGYYGVTSGDELDRVIEMEAKWLSDLFDTEINSFSFHNPTEFELSCDKEIYGGLLNCYSSSFKKLFGYCSDSNGYWRHKRLYDFLKTTKDIRVQILTHPGWWQEKPMMPRQRIERCISGRLEDIRTRYDASLTEYGRRNIR